MSFIEPLINRLRRRRNLQWKDISPKPRGKPTPLKVVKAKYGEVFDEMLEIYHTLPPDQLDKFIRLQLESHRTERDKFVRTRMMSQRGLRKILLKEKPDDVEYLVSRLRPYKGEHDRPGLTVSHLFRLVTTVIDAPRKMELARLIRKVSLQRTRHTNLTLTLKDNASLARLIEQVVELVQMQIAVELPPDYFEMQAWLMQGDLGMFQAMIKDTEQELLYRRVADLVVRAQWLKRITRSFPKHVDVRLVFEIETACVTIRIERSNMSEEEPSLQSDQDLLAKWQELEIEAKFRSGDIAYPEYVLRHLDQFFDKAEQAELHKLAAQHGLELERMLMEIRIKSKTSEEDIKRLIDILKDLDKQNIRAEVVSRHETASGHIEIRAKSRRFPGCSVLAILVLALEVAHHLWS